MLCGRPVMATDVAGNSEVIEDGVTGSVAEASTAGSMDEALERFWARRADAQMMGRGRSKKMCQLIPPDPVQIFWEQLEQILRTSETSTAGNHCIRSPTSYIRVLL